MPSSPVHLPKRVAILVVSFLMLEAAVARAIPIVRLQVEQAGNFVLVGNTVGQDCAVGVPLPIAGAVGSCGANANDRGADVLWRSDSPGLGQAQADSSITAALARSSSVLALPAKATVTLARLYWAAEVTGPFADGGVVVDRPGAPEMNVMADAFNLGQWNGRWFYQSSADVTGLVETMGAGVFRVGGVATLDPVDRLDDDYFIGWSMVVFYTTPVDPPRLLTLLDGYDIVTSQTPVDAQVTGLDLPAQGISVQIGVVAYGGSAAVTGDSLSCNGLLLANPLNPVDNFFNSTHSTLGLGVSRAGDLPRVTGGAGTMSGIDLDVIDVSSAFQANQTVANLQARSSGSDHFAVGAWVLAVLARKPLFGSSVKSVADLNGNSVRPGDVLEYTVVVDNTGNEDGEGVVLDDLLPPQVTYVPGTLHLAVGANAGPKTDAVGDDEAEYLVATRGVRFRLGAGAGATQGGTIPLGGSSTVRFRVVVDAGAAGMIANQATITAGGSGGPPSTFVSTDGGGVPGRMTVVFIETCASNPDCPSERPHCNVTGKPSLCGGCVGDSDCGGLLPACRPGGACGQCSSTNRSACRGAGCNDALGMCLGGGGGDGDAACSWVSDGGRAACGPVALDGAAEGATLEAGQLVELGTPGAEEGTATDGGDDDAGADEMGTALDAPVAGGPLEPPDGRFAGGGLGCVAAGRARPSPGAVVVIAMLVTVLARPRRRASPTRRALRIATGFLVAALTGTTVHAAGDGFQLERYEPSPAGQWWMTVREPWYLATRRLAAGLSFDHAHQPLLFGSDGARGAFRQTTAVIAQQAVAHIDVAAAVIDRIALSLSWPVTLYERGEAVGGVSPVGAPTAGDPRLGASVQVIAPSPRSRLALSLGVDAWIPIGAAGAHAGDHGVRLLAVGALAGRFSALGWALHVGFLARPDAAIGQATTSGVASVGNEIQAAAGLAWRAAGDTLRVGIEAALGTLATRRAFTTDASSVEILVGAHFLVAETMLVGVGLGVGVLRQPGTPDARLVVRAAFAPMKQQGIAANFFGDGEDAKGQAVTRPQATPVLPRTESGAPSVERFTAPAQPLAPPVDAAPASVRNADNTAPLGAPRPPTAETPPPRTPPAPSAPVLSTLPPPSAPVSAPAPAAIVATPSPPRPQPPPSRPQPPPPAPATTTRAPDRDGDGVPDAADLCPTVDAGLHPDPTRPGCPLADRDADSVPDAEDACPTRPGSPHPDPARNGCPGLVALKGKQIAIGRPVHFATGQDVLLADSFPVLEAVAAALTAQREIRRVSIEGYTDDVGTTELNLDLSQRRAESVMRWLVESGVDPERLEAHGFGRSRPVSLSRRDYARAMNRRVEFRIVSPAGPH